MSQHIPISFAIFDFLTGTVHSLGLLFRKLTKVLNESCEAPSIRFSRLARNFGTHFAQELIGFGISTKSSNNGGFCIEIKACRYCYLRLPLRSSLCFPFRSCLFLRSSFSSFFYCHDICWLVLTELQQHSTTFLKNF